MKTLIVFLVLCLALTHASNNTICAKGYNLVNNKCWKLFQDAASHANAERSCSADGGTLFMAKNAIDNRAVASFVSSSGVDHLWMGVFCIGNSRNVCYYDDQTGSTLLYDNFAAGFPNSATGRCVYYSVPGYPTGQWLNGDCLQKLSYVCELPTTHPDVCELNFNDNCYFTLDAFPFSDGQQQCEQLCANMVSVHSSEENRYITSLYSTSSYDFIRLGGMAPSSNFVTWNDGSIMDYNNMERFDSTGCLYMSLKNDYYHSTGSWYTADCTTPKHILCKRPIGAPNCRSTPVPITPPPITPPTCNSGVHVAPGWIATPRYPSAYNAACQYTLTTFGSNRIRIYFFYGVYTPNSNDQVNIYDGDSTDAPRLATLYGKVGDQLYTSTGNTMFIDFVYRSGSTSTYSGFNATFFSIF
ncbi:hypothetical protein CAEBREN_23042 [Caenorhabditis brenneri]|uniref:C-type LECtin n=1 Tax=Caenorhabditis brenneri TaxID=135651 RepID=G0N320_CAEBE|nr:hypothetical protein CAEBREN_23042 [Caenorhabditis brenneri]